MPKRRSSRSGGRGRRRVAADWVYRSSGGFSSAPGTYNGRVSFTVAANSPPTQQILSNANILYDSQDYLEVMNRETIGNALGMPMAARAEGRRALCWRVQGSIMWRPANGWAAGGIWHMGMRLGWYEQDPQAGALSVVPEYSMWEPEIVNGVQGDVAVWANDRLMNMREWRMVTTFDAEKEIAFIRQYINVRVPIPRAPSSIHCLAMYVEAPSTITQLVANTQYFMNLRTLVSDEG